ncbi:hypothetical protein GIB67_029506 [Kingdonia uniflora]|uniref:Uncharacterized protein n=1 Tax=Kingdonia uniflora TaxID=39325 RepID=A0A7J7NYT6_9MAGN|nr:hypothetical protein GIB67_029506 [Kingdonia uniflora]
MVREKVYKEPWEKDKPEEEMCENDNGHEKLEEILLLRTTSSQEREAIGRIASQRKKKTYGFKEIEDTRKQASADQHHGDVLCLNLLDIIQSIVLPNKGKSNKERYVDLVDNLDDFKKFPWEQHLSNFVMSQLVEWPEYQSAEDKMHEIVIEAMDFMDYVGVYQIIKDKGLKGKEFGKDMEPIEVNNDSGFEAKEAAEINSSGFKDEGDIDVNAIVFDGCGQKPNHCGGGSVKKDLEKWSIEEVIENATVGEENIDKGSMGVDAKYDEVEGGEGDSDIGKSEKFKEFESILKVLDNGSGVGQAVDRLPSDLAE